MIARLAALLVVFGTLGSWATGAEAQPGPATDALLAATQEDSRSPQRYGALIDASVQSSLAARGIRTRPESKLGASLVSCETPECMESRLLLADVEFGVVPALWLRPETGGYELTLTFIERSGRTANVQASVDPSRPQSAVDELVDAGLERRDRQAAVVDPVARAAMGTDHPPKSRQWMAGPTLLIAGGLGTLIAVGVKAAQQGCTLSVAEVCVEQRELRTAGVAAASALAAGAILGGTAWWVVGSKRRRQGARKHASLGIGKSQVHFRLDY